MENQIEGNVTKSTKVLIRAKTTKVDLHDTLYAVNWFSTKVEWVYHLYNFLATKSVLKIGGRPFFKGKTTKIVLDQNGTERDLILIVRYPNGNSFKTLMQSTYFKIVSILRMISVKEFTFGFTEKKIINTNSKLEDHLHYAVHHFKYDGIDEALFLRFTTALPKTVSITYAGGMIAQLWVQKNTEEAKQVPNLMDGLLIYEATSETELSDMFISLEYKTLIGTMQSSYIGHLKRIL